MLEIKRYKIKDGININDVVSFHGVEKCDWSFVHKDAKFGMAKYIYSRKLDFEVSIYVTFSENLQEWDDFNYVLVLDDDFGQPYTAFYRRLEQTILPAKQKLSSTENKYVDWVVEEYNKFMDSISFLEEI